MIKGFWSQLKKPIIGLAPMDGVTDAAFRFMVDKYGHPDILITEFTSVEGLSRGAVDLLSAFIYHQTTTPTVAQIFGTEPQAFYQTAFIISELGFNGIDINMGCPDKNVAKRGGGAGLILRPKLAQEIIRMTQKGTFDWAHGRKIEEIGLSPKIIDWIRMFQQQHQIKPTFSPLPVSVKTRIGYDQIVTTDWIQTLLEVEPVNISLHGRTLKQLYTGYANWEEIGKAAELIKKTETTLLGNGDVTDLKDAQEKITTYGVDGVLIGRASFGNPWIFQNKKTQLEEKLQTAIEHAEKFEEMTPHLNFLSLRKHMAWYCKGFDNASLIRSQLVMAKNANEIKNIITPLLQ